MSIAFQMIVSLANPITIITFRFVIYIFQEWCRLLVLDASVWPISQKNRNSSKFISVRSQIECAQFKII